MKSAEYYREANRAGAEGSKELYPDPAGLPDALRLEYLKLEKQVSHYEMAEVSGVARSMFSMWLSGQREVTKIDMLSRLIRALPTLKLLC